MPRSSRCAPRWCPRRPRPGPRRRAETNTSRSLSGSRSRGTFAVMQNGSAPTGARCAGGHGFVHEALFYGSPEEFLRGTLPFIREGLAADEPVLVAVAAQRIRLLSGVLGPDAGRVAFADMAHLGRNPAAIIAAWRDFVDRDVAARGAGRGIGEPIWPGRAKDEIVEAQHHESLLNLAFGDG